jgi:O-antigen/teichoic acid export membrane protein
MVFALFVTPVIIFRLGIKNYGIYLFINAIIALFGLLDLGLGTAVMKHLSSYHGAKNIEASVDLVHSANSLFLIVGLVGFMLSICVALFGPNILPMEFSNYRQYSPLFIIGGATFLVTSIVTSYNTIFTALQRFDITNKIGIVYITLSSLGMLAVILSGGLLRSIFLVQLCITILFGLVTVYQARKIFPQATFHFGWNVAEIKHCYRFGLIAFINNIASTALASLDRLIIPFYAGPSNLTYYSLPGNVTGKIPGISNILGATMFPTTSQLDGEKSMSRIETLYVRSFRLITIIGAALCVTAIAFAYKILLYWLNADFANHSADILVVLAFTNFILALFGPLSNFLLGLGKLKFLTIMSVIMGVLNATLLILLLPRYGITGAAWAYLISVLPVGYMFYHTEKKYLTLSDRGHYYVKKIGGTVLVSFIVWVIDTYILSQFVVDLPTLLLMGGVSFLCYVLLYRFLGFFEEKDWADVESFVFALGKKFRIVR